MTHAVLHSTPGRAPTGLPWHLVQTEVVWSSEEDRTPVWKDKLVSSVAGKPPPYPPGHWPRSGLFILSHQGLQGEKQSKEHGRSKNCGAWRLCGPRECTAAGPGVPETSPAELLPSREPALRSTEPSTGRALRHLPPFPEGMGLAVASLTNAEFRRH